MEVGRGSRRVDGAMVIAVRKAKETRPEAGPKELSAALGVSASTVRRVLRGERDEEGNIVSPKGDEVRCAGCGAKVVMPCRLCGLRERVVRRN